MSANYEYESAIIDKNIQELSLSIFKLRKNIIGVFLEHDNIEFILEKSDSHIKTIKITNFLGIHISHYPICLEKIVNLPKGFSNLEELYNQPLIYSDWINKQILKNDKKNY